MKKIALVTGATSGIGEACAIKFAEHGWDVITTGRRKDRLQENAAYLSDTFHIDVLPLCFDVRNLEEVRSNIGSLSGKWKTVNLLVNNAGLAVGKGRFDEGVYDDWERMVDTNLKGLAYISKEVARLFKSNGSGHIINIGSMAGHEVYPGGNMYCATKHAVLALSKGMRIDLVKYNIKVSVVSPGATETEFSIVRFKGDEDLASLTYDGYVPLTAKDIADSVWFIASQPDHVNIDEIYLTPKAQASPFVLDRKA